MSLTPRAELEVKIRDIVTRVAEAARMGGGFRVYFESVESAVTELADLLQRPPGAKRRR